LQDRDTHEPVNLYRFVRCFPPDVISKYVFGKSDVISRADTEFRNDIVEVLDLLVATIWDRAYHPWKTTITNYVPMGIAAAISGNVAKMIAFINLVNQRVQEFRAGQSKTKFPPVISSMTDQAEDSVQLAAMGLLAAGSDTTGYTIYAAARELIRDPLLRRHLVSELDTAFSHTESSFPDLATLQHLPLLTAIINETLRFYPAVEGRLPREVPKPTKDPLIIDGVLIPPGTIVGISARTMHRHPQIWGADDAETFRPARWLEDQNNNKESNERSKVKISPNNLVAFSKGSRNCVGQTLALAEIYIALAFLFQKFEFEYVSGPFEGVDEDLYMRTVRESISVRISLREEKR
jgi:cytochrome P450